MTPLVPLRSLPEFRPSASCLLAQWLCTGKASSLFLSCLSCFNQLLCARQWAGHGGCNGKGFFDSWEVEMGAQDGEAGQEGFLEKESLAES